MTALEFIQRIDRYTFKKIVCSHSDAERRRNLTERLDDITILDSDIAIIEALHDLLLDREGYPLKHPTLRRSRELTGKLHRIIDANFNK